MSYDDLYEEFTPADAKEELYWQSLEAFWYQVRKIEKDWEELNWFEVDNVKMQFAEYKEAEEAHYNPTDYYMLEGRSCG